MDRQRFRNGFHVLISFLCLGGIAAVLSELGRNSFTEIERFFKAFDTVALGFLFADIAVRFFSRTNPGDFVKKNPFALAVFILYVLLTGWSASTPLNILGITMGKDSMIRFLLILRLILISLKLLSSIVAIRDFFANLSHNPAKSIMLGFAIVILTGALFLSLPVSLQQGKTISFTDALFTSTSAVCVTGLIVVDTGTHFSFFGQLVIMLLIQIGGLGIMTLAVFIGLFLKDRLSIRERQTTQSILDQTNATSVYDLIRKIILITFLIELIGAVAIYISTTGTPPPPGAGRDAGPVFYSIFHSISAFCNAGFSLNRDSLMYLSGDLHGNISFMFLIISGGLGFTVILNLKDRFFKKRKQHLLGTEKTRERLTLHTRIVLVMTLILLLVGAIFFFFAEDSASLKGRGPAERILASFFQSTTTRTAGFNTVDFGALHPATLVLFLALMLIGASPGSTGGGIKTTTFAVMILTVISMLKEKRDVEAGRRLIPRDIVNKSLAIIILFLGMIFTASLIILLAESSVPFLKILFEVISASATVGLSTGITAALSGTSKFVIIITMFLGRIGPLTLVMAMTLHSSRKKLVRYPEEKIMVG